MADTPAVPELGIEHIGRRIHISTRYEDGTSIAYLGTLVFVTARTDEEGRLTQNVILEGDPRSIRLTDFTVAIEGDFEPVSLQRGGLEL